MLMIDALNFYRCFFFFSKRAENFFFRFSVLFFFAELKNMLNIETTNKVAAILILLLPIAGTGKRWNKNSGSSYVAVYFACLKYRMRQLILRKNRNTRRESYH